MVSPITQPPVLRNYIGGSWCRADASDTLEVRNPATDEVLALVPSATPATSRPPSPAPPPPSQAGAPRRPRNVPAIFSSYASC
jgi:hypothetical protein